MSTIRRCWRAVVLALCLLSGCGGGGGGGSGTPALSLTLSTNSITFNAAAPWAPTPSNQNITATITGSASGTLFLIIDPTGSPFVSVTNVFITPPNSGQATIVPASPATVGSGNHRGTITVRACINDPTCRTGEIGGSPKTINVAYNVDPTVEADTVTPRVVDANTGGTVILRGRSLAGVTSVSFGGTPGSVTVVSNTEVVASYPPLAAGSYPIALNSGALAFSATLVATAPAGYTATFLPHPAPSGMTAHTITLEYDAARRALLVAVFLNGQQPQLLRYVFSNGTWSSPASVQVDNLRQVRLSHDGSKLLALRSTMQPSTTSIDELDAITFATTASTPLTFAVGEGNLALSFALANDGNLLLPTRPPGSGFTRPLLFATTRRVFLSVPVLVSSESSVASGNGSKVFLPDSGLMYNASSATFTSVLAATSGFARPPSADRTGARIQSGTGVFNGSLEAIGFARNTSTTTHVAAVINREGTRLYSLDNTGHLHTFDVTAPPTGGGAFPSLVEIGSPIALAGDIGTTSFPGPALVITPDGTTVFASGFLGVAVQPVPR